jgi:hypothetical protein
MTPNAIQKAAGGCRRATEEEIEAVEWAKDVRRKQLGTLGEALQRIVILTTAVLGGSAALLTEVPVPSMCKALAVILLLATLGLSLWGALPLSGRFDDRCAAEIIAERARGVRRRASVLYWSSGLLFAAFAVVVGGLLARL